MKKKPQTNLTIRHLSSSFGGNLFAIAKFEKEVEIWNIQEAKRVSQFDTNLDYGGERIAISPIHSINSMPSSGASAIISTSSSCE